MNKSRRNKLNEHKRKSIKNKLRRKLKKQKSILKKQIKYRKKRYGNPIHNLICQIKEQEQQTFNKKAYKPPSAESNSALVEINQKEKFAVNKWLPPAKEEE